MGQEQRGPVALSRRRLTKKAVPVLQSTSGAGLEGLPKRYAIRTRSELNRPTLARAHRNSKAMTRIASAPAPPGVAELRFGERGPFPAPLPSRERISPTPDGICSKQFASLGGVRSGIGGWGESPPSEPSAKDRGGSAFDLKGRTPSFGEFRRCAGFSPEPVPAFT